LKHIETPKQSRRAQPGLVRVATICADDRSVKLDPGLDLTALVQDRLDNDPSVQAAWASLIVAVLKSASPAPRNPPPVG
jgi:hypothetical protein